MKRALLAIPLALALSGCGSKYPDTAAVHMAEGNNGVTFSGVVLEVNKSLENNMENLLELREEINAYVGDPESTELSFKRDLSREAQAELKALRDASAEARAAQRAQYATWRQGVTSALEETRNSLGELEADASRYQAFREEAVNELEAAQQAIKDSEARQQEIGEAVRLHTNQRIIDDQLAVRQLPENRSALSWTESTWREADMPYAECIEKPGTVMVDLLEEHRMCVNVSYPVAELAGEEYDDMLRTAITEYMGLSQSIGQTSGWSRSATGLHLRVAEARDGLEKATILAENQTGLTERALNETRRTLTSRIEQNESQLAEAEAQVADGHYPYYTGVDNSSDVGAWQKRREILLTYLEGQIEEQVNRSIINQVELSSSGEATGLTGKADYLIVPMDVSKGAFSGYSYNATTGYFLSLSEEEPTIKDGRLIMDISEDDLMYGSYKDESLLDLLYVIFEARHYDEQD